MTATTPVHELTTAAHILRADSGAQFGLLAPSVSALLTAAAQRLASQLPAWRGTPKENELVSNLYGAELAVARLVLQQTGQLRAPP